MVKEGELVKVFKSNGEEEDSDEESRDLTEDESEALKQFEENDKELEDIAL